MIKLIKSTFYKEEETKKQLVEFILKAKILSFSKECEKFEKNFARWQGRKYCIYVNSGSSANLALIQAFLNLGWLKKEDSVAFSSVTWSTNLMPILQLGLKAVPVDIELNTLNVSSKKLLEVIDKHDIKMFFLTNALGFCSDIDVIKEVCHSRNILFVEDNCESLGTIYKGQKLGNYGIASTNSFYVGHHLSTIEGGAICTDDEELAILLKLVRAHGWDRNLTFAKQTEIRQKFQINSEFYSRYTFYDLGYNLRPTEINGFIGNKQLSYIDEIIQKRSENFLKIAEVIYSSELLHPINYKHIDLASNFAVPIICTSKDILQRLVERCKGTLEIRPIVGGNITQQPFFNKYMNHQNTKLCNNAKLIHEQGFYFGNNPELTDGEIKEITTMF